MFGILKWYKVNGKTSQSNCTCRKKTEQLPGHVMNVLAFKNSAHMGQNRTSMHKNTKCDSESTRLFSHVTGGPSQVGCTIETWSQSHLTSVLWTAKFSLGTNSSFKINNFQQKQKMQSA